MSQSTSTFAAALRAEWPARQSRLSTALIASLTLGLAPYYPHAHVYKQLVNLWHGTLSAPIDVFDLVLHGAPWVWLFVVAGGWIAAARARRARA